MRASPVSLCALRFRWPWTVTTSGDSTSNGCARWLASWSRSPCCSPPPSLRIYATADPASPWRTSSPLRRRPTPTTSSWTCRRWSCSWSCGKQYKFKVVLTTNRLNNFACRLKSDRNSTPWSGRAEVRWAAVRSSVSPSPERLSGILGSCCWTWRPLPSTTRARP